MVVHTVGEFNYLVKPKNIDKFEHENCACKVYAHFANGFSNKNGFLVLHLKNIDCLPELYRWFVSASTLLDYLQPQREGEYASSFYLNKLEVKLFIDRIVKKNRFGRL